MDAQRYIDALKAGDAPDAIVALVAAEAAREALERASVSIEDEGWLVPEEGRMAAAWLRSRADGKSWLRSCENSPTTSSTR